MPSTNTDTFGGGWIAISAFGIDTAGTAAVFRQGVSQFQVFSSCSVSGPALGLAAGFQVPAGLSAGPASVEIVTTEFLAGVGQTSSLPSATVELTILAPPAPPPAPVATVSRLNLSPLGPVNVAATVNGIILDHGASQLYTLGQRSKNVAILDTSTYSVKAAPTLKDAPLRQAFDDGADLLYVLVPDLNLIQVVDTTTLQVVDSREMSLGFRPRFIAVDDDGSNRLYVVGSQDVWIYDTTSFASPVQLQLLATSAGILLDKANDTLYIPTSQGLAAVRPGLTLDEQDFGRPEYRSALNPVTKRIYMTTADAILVVDDSLAALTLEAVIQDPVIFEPWDVDVNSITNQVYVALSASDEVLILDGATNGFSVVSGPSLEWPLQVAVDEANNLVWVSNSETAFFPGKITRIEPGNGNAVTGFSIPVETNDITIDPVNDLLYMTKGNLALLTVSSRLDPSNPVAEVVTGVSFRDLVVSNSGRVFVTDITSPGTIHVIDADSFAVIDQIDIFGNRLGFREDLGFLYSTNVPPGTGTNDAGQVLQFDAATSVLLRSLPSAGGFPGRFFIDDVNNRVYNLAAFFSAVPGGEVDNVQVIEEFTGNDTVLERGLFILVGGVNRATNKMYTPMLDPSGDRTLGVLSGVPSTLSPIPLGGDTYIADVAVDEIYSRVYALSDDQILVIDGVSDTLIATSTTLLPSYGQRMVLNAATERLYVATWSGIQVYSVAGGGAPLFVETIFDSPTFEANWGAMTVDETNNLIAVVDDGGERVLVIDGYDHSNVQVFPDIQVWISRGMDFHEPSATLFTFDFLTGSVVKIGPFR